MSKLAIAVASLSLAACASTQTTLDHDTAMRAKVRLDLTLTGDAAIPAFPSAIDPAVPSVDRISHSIRARLGETATAELELCVSPAGHVTKVALARGSTFEAFDAALLRDAESWQFATMPGPAGLQACRHATIAYRAR